MKKILFLLLVSLSCFGQTPPEQNARNKINAIRGRQVLRLAPGELSAAFDGLLSLGIRSTPYLSMAQLRAGWADTASVVVINDLNKAGVFRYNSAQTLPDDSVMRVKVGSKVYERQYDGYVNAKWFGLSGDGVTNQTWIWTKMLNDTTIKSIYFPKPKNTYRIHYINVPSNKTLIFESGTEVRGLGVLDAFRQMINIVNVSNVTFKGENVIFSDIKANYPTGESGQFNGCFRILSAENVLIQGITVKESGGDGFYIGAGTYGVPSKNIKLIECGSLRVNRNGITLISVIGFEARRCRFIGNTGSSPAAGIDMEPNNISEKLTDIKITDCYTEGNAGTGILVAPINLRNAGNIIDVVVQNHTDDGSLHGAQVGELTGSLDGIIRFENCTWKNSIQQAFLSLNYSSRGPRVEIINPEIINACAQPFYTITAAIAIYRRVSGGDANVGNIHIIRPRIKDIRATPYGGVAIYIKDETGANILNCTVTDPLEITGYGEGLKYYALKASVLLSDAYNVLTRIMASDYSTNVGGVVYNKYTNAGATGTVTLNLGNYTLQEIGQVVNVEVLAGFPLRILPDLATLRPLQTAGSGNYISSNVVGSRLQLKKISGFSWEITEITGVWTDIAGVQVYNDGFVSERTKMIIQGADVGLTDDLNNYLTTGSYKITNATSLTNKPSSKAGILTVVNNGTSVFQHYQDRDNDQIYWRSSAGLSFSGAAWKLMATSFYRVFAYNPPPVPAGNTLKTTTTATITGAQVGQLVSVSWSASLNGMSPPIAAVVATDQVEITWTNPTTSSIDLANGFFRFTLTSTPTN